jgi:hypothetical protein
VEHDNGTSFIFSRQEPVCKVRMIGCMCVRAFACVWVCGFGLCVCVCVCVCQKCGPVYIAVDLQLSMRPQTNL